MLFAAIFFTVLLFAHVVISACNAYYDRGLVLKNCDNEDKLFLFNAVPFSSHFIMLLLLRDPFELYSDSITLKP